MAAMSGVIRSLTKASHCPEGRTHDNGNGQIEHIAAKDGIRRIPATYLSPFAFGEFIALTRITVLPDDLAPGRRAPQSPSHASGLSFTQAAAWPSAPGRRARR